MKIPLDWLKEYVDLAGLSPEEIGEAFTQIGLMLDKPFDGKVFDLEHRFDRADWLSVLGCARDLAAYLNRELKLPKTYTKEGKKPKANQVVPIKIDCPNAVHRFNTRVFRNIKVGPSPDWLKSRLEEYGMTTINNVVDITNYVMIELGQPMHAQDLAKLRKQEIVIRNAQDEEKIVTFLGDEVTLYSDAFVLTQDKVPTVLGGIVGGRETGVDQQTTDIILDAGNYDQTVIRKVSRQLKIQNETVSRYDKYLHPNLTQYAIERATYLLLELAGGEYYQNVDWYPKKIGTKEMTLRTARVLKLAGFDIPSKSISNILLRLGYQIKNQSRNSFKVVVPYFRTDIEVEDDIGSDIIRIYGYSKITTAQIESAPPKEITPKIYTFETVLRDMMVDLGAHEHITDPLVSRNEKLEGKQINLVNSQNINKNALRTKLAETLQEIIPNYVKNQIESGVLFEVGKIYFKDSIQIGYQSYQEVRVLEVLAFDQRLTPKELHQKISALLTGLLRQLGIQNTAFKFKSTQEAEVYAQDHLLGTVRYNGFTLLTEELLLVTQPPQRVITAIQIPNALEISLIIPTDLPVGTIISALVQEKIVDKVDFLEEYKDEQLGRDKRAVLLKIHFPAEIDQDTARKTIGNNIAKLKETFDITIRS